eukprot:3236766-Pyramimonas_sp.AAC.1
MSCGEFSEIPAVFIAYLSRPRSSPKMPPKKFPPETSCSPSRAEPIGGPPRALSFKTDLLRALLGPMGLGRTIDLCGILSLRRQRRRAPTPLGAAPALCGNAGARSSGPPRAPPWGPPRRPARRGPIGVAPEQ